MNEIEAHEIKAQAVHILVVSFNSEIQGYLLNMLTNPEPRPIVDMLNDIARISSQLAERIEELYDDTQ